MIDFSGSLVDPACEIGADGLVWTMSAALPAVLLAGLVIAIQFVGGRWLRPGQRALLWGLVLCRLALPIAPESAVSLQSLFSSDDAPQSDPWEPRPVAALAPATPGDALQAATLPTPPEPAFEDILYSVVPLVWLAGCLSIFGWTSMSYLRLVQRMKRAPVTDDSRLLRILNESREQLRLPWTVSLILTDAVRQPAVMGIWRPTVLLPRHLAERSDHDLRMVLLHELTHVRCRDVAMNWLLLVVRAAHWWNPVCWLAASRFLHLREQSRDVMVLRAIDGDARRDYSTLLIALAERGGAPARWRVIVPGLLPGLVCGLFEKRAVASRLKAIRHAGRPQSRLQLAVAGTIVVAAAVTGCTDPLSPAPELRIPRMDAATEEAFQRGFGRMVSTSDADSANPVEPLESRTYDVTAAVKQIAEVHHVDLEVAAESARRQILWMIELGKPRPAAEDAAAPRAPAATVRMEGERRLVDVDAAPSDHEQLAQSIPAWETGGLTQVCIEVRVISSPIDLAARGHVAWNSISAPTAAMPIRAESPNEALSVAGSSAIEKRLAVMTSVLGEPAFRRFMQVFQDDSDSNIMFAPKITMFNGQSGTITSEVQRPFVTGVRLVDGRREPQIEVCPEGTQIEVRPVLASDRKSARLTGRALFSTILDVNTTSAQLTDGPVTIQLPSVERRTIDFHSELRDGESLLVAAPPQSGSEGYFYLALTARVVAEKDAGLFAISPDTP